MKKLNVVSYIYDTHRERGQKAFEKKVAKLLRSADISGDVICHNAWYERGSWYGHYVQVIEIEINRETYFLRHTITDASMWDNWHEPTAKDKRALFLSVLEERIETVRNILNKQD